MINRVLHGTIRATGRHFPAALGWWLARQLVTPQPVPQLPLAPPGAVGRRRQIPFSGTHLAATEWGEGPLVLLVHGWGSRSEAFWGMVDPLVASGFRPVALDFPAHGRSGGTRTTMIHCAEALTTVGHAFGSVYGVIGHSFGGPTAALAAKKGLRIERMVMAAPPESVRGELTTMARASGVPDAVFARVARGFEERLHFDWAELDTVRLTSHLTVPLFVVHDETDRVTPFAGGQAVAAAHPYGSFFGTSGLGHRRVLADPIVTQKILEFLAGPCQPPSG